MKNLKNTLKKLYEESPIGSLQNDHEEKVKKYAEDFEPVFINKLKAAAELGKDFYNFEIHHDQPIKREAIELLAKKHELICRNAPRYSMDFRNFKNVTVSGW